MSRQISATAIGGFIIGILGLTAAALLFFGGNNFFAQTHRFEIIYRSSIQGLRVGAPVTIKGTKIGEVVDINVKMIGGNKLDIYNDVVISIQPDMVYREDTTSSNEMLLDELIHQGLAAQLKTQSFLTGLLYINLDFFDDENKPHFENVPTEYTQLPTVQTDLQEISQSLAEIDFKGIAKDLEKVMNGLDRIINNPDTQMMTRTLTDTGHAISQMADITSTQIKLFREDFAPVADETGKLVTRLNEELPAIIDHLDSGVTALEQALNNLENVSASARFALSDDSPTLNAITNAANSLKRAADSVDSASSVIEQQPESLLWGKRSNE